MTAAITDSPAAHIAPRDVVSGLKKHILVDGFELVLDFERSQGSYFVDAPSGRRLIDLYGFYATLVVGFNHPYFKLPEVREELTDVASFKVANSDVYSQPYAEFVEAFSRVCGRPELPRYFFIDGGTLAVENALKAAMDWKVRKNMAAGRGEIGTQILHFREAFHGRSGYTMSLTNTDPKKTDLFAKFDWPRVSNPKLDFNLAGAERDRKAAADEVQTVAEIRAVLAARPHQVCAILIEPIQGEGGDNHFRREFFRTLRQLCDEHDLLLIFDEVQAGMGVTGKMWCWEHFGVAPDLMAFAKKAQTCGVMAGPRVYDLPDNVFKMPSRINSTWGGNLVDMVRCKHLLRIYESEGLVDNAARMGARAMAQLEGLASEFPQITAVRGRGLMIAFDLPTPEARNNFWKGCFESGLLVLKSGHRSIRLRPALDIAPEVIDEAVGIMAERLKRGV